MICMALPSGITCPTTPSSWLLAILLARDAATIEDTVWQLAIWPAGRLPLLGKSHLQKGERRVVVQGPGDTAYLTVAYRAPAASHPDYLPLVLLNAAFAGGSSLGMFGGSGSNKSSRLYKALVNTELAASAYGSLTPTIDPFLYTINAVVQAGRSLPKWKQRWMKNWLS